MNRIRDVPEVFFRLRLRPENELFLVLGSGKKGYFVAGIFPAPAPAGKRLCGWLGKENFEIFSMKFLYFN